MKHSSSGIAIAVLLSFASSAYGQVATTCLQNGICYSINVPESTASSGNGDIFFQITAATSFSWVSLGQGSNGMDGANIFVMYTSADGNNVTMSPRLGTGEVQPQHNSNAQITLLEGSGVENGRMTANVRCSSCNSWSGGSMDFTQTNTRWIHAYKSGSALDSDDVSANIQQHDDADGFSWDLTSAKGGSEANPFVAAAVNTSSPSASASDSSTASAPTATSSSSSTSSGSDSSLGSISSASGFEALSASRQNAIQLAHAVLATVAFVAMFPIGGILIRLAHFPGLLWTHIVLQGLAYAIYIAAVGLGLYMATSEGYLPTSHAIIGLVLFGILFFQPLLGWLHHKLFKKNGGRTAWSYAHLTIGRAAIILGLVNGGLGLQLAGADRASYIAYGVCAGVVGVAYLAAIAFGEVRRRSQPAGSGREKDGPQRNSGSESEQAMRQA